jgi:hypothetical protein
MSEYKKALLDFQTQEKLWNLLQNEDEVIREIASDPELQRVLLDSELDEKAGRIYTVDEAIKFIKEYNPK